MQSKEKQIENWINLSTVLQQTISQMMKGHNSSANFSDQDKIFLSNLIKARDFAFTAVPDEFEKQVYTQLKKNKTLTSTKKD